MTVIKENVFYKDDDTNVIGVILNGGKNVILLSLQLLDRKGGEREGE